MSERIGELPATPQKRKRRTKAEMEAARAAEAAAKGGGAAPSTQSEHVTPKAPATPKAKQDKGPLFDALKFVSPGYKEGGEPYSTHALIYGGWISTFDGVLCFGAVIPDQLYALPNFAQFFGAIKAAGDGIAITQPEFTKLSISSGRIRVAVPCLPDPALVHRPAPDAPIGPLDNRIKTGFEVLSRIASDNAEHVMCASVLMSNGVMYATDRSIFVEFNHGIGFPTLAVPRGFIHAVLKCGKDVVSFGYSEHSLTFWFADHSYIRTNLWDEKWPENFERVLPTDFSKSLPVPEGFFEAVADVKPFAAADSVFFDEDEIRTHSADAEAGAVIVCKGTVQVDRGFSIRRLLLLDGIVSHLDYWSEDRRMIFCGSGVRGVLASQIGNHEPDPDPRTMMQRPAAPESPAKPPIAATAEPGLTIATPALDPGAAIPATNFPIGSRVRTPSGSGTVEAHATYSLRMKLDNGGDLHVSTSDCTAEGPQASPGSPPAAFVPPKAPAEAEAPKPALSGFVTPGDEPSAPSMASEPLQSQAEPVAHSSESAGFWMPTDAT